MTPDIRDRLEIIQGDITRLAVDAVVNAANRSLLGGGGVDGAIHRAAGPGLLTECRALGGCPTGQARITGGYNLPARHVIHTVGPVYSGSEEDPRRLADCYLNCLRLAVDHGLASIAFPAISCGAYGYPVQDASRVALGTVACFLQKGAGIKRVLFVLYSPRDTAVYRSCLEGPEFTGSPARG